MHLSTRRFAPLVLSSLSLLAGCGADDFVGDDMASGDTVDLYSEDMSGGESIELGQVGQALAASCGGDDSNSLAAGLAVAIANELGRWDVATDFVVTSGKLELSATGKLICGSGCPKTTALLRMQDDASSTVPNHVPATYRSKLTGWYNTQKTQLTNLVGEMLKLDQGVFRIRSKQSGKYLVPAGGSTSSGATVQQSDQYSSTTAAQWRVKLNGTNQQLVNIKSGLCLDLASDTNGKANIVQKACSGGATQNFRLGQLDAGVLTVRSKYNLALQPQSGSTANNAVIVQDVVKGLTPEMFIFEKYGSGTHRDLLETATAVYNLKVAHTGMAIAVSSSSTADNVGVVQQPYSASDDRFHWYVTQLGTGNVNGIDQTTYQFMNRRTGKCLDLNGKNMVQRTCSTAWTQRFMLTPTGNLRQVLYTTNGYTVGVKNSSTGSGAALVEENAKTWQMNNMMAFEPIIAIEPHRLVYSHTTKNGPCGDYDWYDISQPNGLSLDDPTSTWVQLIFAGGKQSSKGADVNPYIAQQVSGDLVAIDPTSGLNASNATSTGSCTAACVKVSTSNVAGSCCSCQGKTAKFAKATWNASTFICQ
ncbi:MAG TPA: RICIN domain-containing protein [Polyangiaceae bacterium]|nr:RICIN domain-containing protein [Polyangiaceae bacterium]